MCTYLTYVQLIIKSGKDRFQTPLTSLCTGPLSGLLPVTAPFDDLAIYSLLSIADKLLCLSYAKAQLLIKFRVQVVSQTNIFHSPEKSPCIVCEK